MADSLRDQLLKSGIVKQVRDDKPARRKNRRNDPRKRQPAPAAAGTDDIDLARAYSIRAQSEAEERKRAAARAEAEARERKQRKRKLQEALHGKALNKADAELARHFEYAGKIRRVYVDPAQMAALNRGELGVVQFSGRHLLVSREVATAVQAFAPEHVALLIDPTATGDAGDEHDVPDDLVW